MTLLQKINLRKKLSEKKLFFLIGVLFLSALAGAKAAIALPDKNMSEITTHTDTDNREYAYIPEDTELIFETTVQGYIEDSYMYAYNDRGTVYLSLAQLAAFIGIIYENKEGVITSYYSNKKNTLYNIDLNNLTAQAGNKNIKLNTGDHKNIDHTIFFSTDFLSRLYDIDIKYDFYDMKIKIDRDEDFPTMVKRSAEKKRKNTRQFKFADRSYKDYEMDNRWFAAPVIDLSLGKGWGHSPKGRTYNSDSYSLNIAAIAAGMDVNSYISGSSSDNHKPQIRLYGGRTLLDEPPNKLHLKQFKIGDINGISNTYFAASSYGRGVTASSFKDLVMSADKTIDIVGPLREGWEVELYWNGQLVGYRQNSIAGEYNFPNIPVSYGLNTFKLVFYGPYGEKYEEEKRYYSGTSPVKKGEIGYNFASYQPDRYLFERNEEISHKGKNVPILDSTFYYGLTDYITIISGLTQTPSAEENNNTQHFGMLGAQYVLPGSSLQYNLESNVDTGKIGHHIELQGDAYIGSVYAMYDKYNGLHSPSSYSGGKYLEDKKELRFSSHIYSIPYYMSYRTGKKEDGSKPYENIIGRMSKNVANNWYLSVEDKYDSLSHENEVETGIYTYKNEYSWNTNFIYQANPNPKFTNFSTQLSWRQDRYTYYTAGYRRDIQECMDYYTVTGSRVFDFGGLTLSLSLDKRGNFSTYLNYNISLSKEPDKFGVLTSAYSKLSSSGAVYATFHDVDGNPLDGIGITANNLVKEYYSDADGKLFITDLIANGKTILNIDMETLEDVSLKPDKEVYKLALRPGTVKKIDVTFRHYGSVDGQIANPYGKRLYGYKVTAIDDKGNELASTFTDLDGYFVLSDIPYGKIKIIVSKDNEKQAEISEVIVNDWDVSLPEEIDTIDSLTPTEDYLADESFGDDIFTDDYIYDDTTDILADDVNNYEETPDTVLPENYDSIETIIEKESPKNKKCPTDIRDNYWIS